MLKPFVMSGLLAMMMIVGCGPGLHVRPGSPVSGVRIEVQEFDMSRAKVESYEAATDLLGSDLAQKIAHGLREADVDVEFVPRGRVAEAKIIVEGYVTKIDGGSRALRYWVGFGAGAAQFAARGTVRSAQGQVLGQFADERRAAVGTWGGASEDLIRNCINEVAEDITRMIVTGEYSVGTGE